MKQLKKWLSEHRLRIVTVDPNLIYAKYTMYRRAYEILDKGTDGEKEYISKYMKENSPELMNVNQVKKVSNAVDMTFFNMRDRNAQ